MTGEQAEQRAAWIMAVLPGTRAQVWWPLEALSRPGNHPGIHVAGNDAFVRVFRGGTEIAMISARGEYRASAAPSE